MPSGTARLDKKMPILDGEPFEESVTRYKFGRSGHEIRRHMRWTARMGANGQYGLWLQEYSNAEGRWRKSPDSIYGLSALRFRELVRFMASLAPRLGELELAEGHMPNDVDDHKWRNAPETREMLDEPRDTERTPGEPGRGPSG